jgi:hypothetical protein
MKQLVKCPTHKSQHTLDLIITRCQTDDRVFLKSVTNVEISDHFLVECGVAVVPSKQPQRTVTCRPLRRVNTEEFVRDLENELRQLQEDADAESFAASFTDLCQKAMDIHAPLKTIRVKGDGLKPWYNDSIHEARVACRRIERLYRKSHLEVHRQMFIEKRKHVVRLIQRCKSE